jgi:hypothetical protein
MYVTSLDESHLQCGDVRYHWMICKQDKPDELVSWGHAPTQEQAEVAAQKEVKDLAHGRSQGGRVVSTDKSLPADIRRADSDRFGIRPVKNPILDTSQRVKDDALLWRWSTVKPGLSGVGRLLIRP